MQSLSPDGKVLLYGSGDIMTLPLTAEGKPEAYLQTKYLALGATFSPDGHWVAYDSDESGGERGVAGGRGTGWANGGLFHLPTEDLLASFQPGRPGRRFLVQEPEGAPQDRPMVQLNWEARLGR